MNKLLGYWNDHGTKILGFAQITLAVLSTSTDVFTPHVLKLLVLASGLATAYRGFSNSNAIAAQPKP
jgi:hypothetical protein